jgi:hypothetical protein
MPLFFMEMALGQYAGQKKHIIATRNLKKKNIFDLKKTLAIKGVLEHVIRLYTCCRRK